MEFSLVVIGGLTPSQKQVMIRSVTWDQTTKRCLSTDNLMFKKSWFLPSTLPRLFGDNYF